MNQVQSIFQHYDTDCSGALSAGEFEEVLTCICPEVQSVDVGQTLELVDTDGSGKIQYEEFLNWLTDPAGLHCARGD